jgi:alpha-amylase
MGVLLQSFYWDCPSAEKQEGKWWDYLTTQIAAIAADGFTALWLPPSSKAANWKSNGYDPYDYYDLGDFDQKGNTSTWFGNKASLKKLIEAAHRSSLQVYADVVLNHNSGADAQEPNPLLAGQKRWTKFTPKSGKFPRNWECFHPCRFETTDYQTFGDMPDLCHRTPDVYKALMDYTRWLMEDIGYDGFRFDFVKGFGPWIVKGIAEYRYQNNGRLPFCVGECWDSDRTIDDWLNAVNAFTTNPVSAFDFPLHYKLKGFCDQFGFDMTTLTDGTLVNEVPRRAVTFVDNHDTIRDPGNAVINDKLLAYAVILTHEGYPSVFWQDYFNFKLAGRGTPNGIAALIAAHEKYAGGTTSVLYADHDLYIMQRNGSGSTPGLVAVFNNRGDAWNGRTVQTQWKTKRMTPVAWWGKTDTSRPSDRWTDLNASVDLWSAPRGYAVYVAG